MLSDWGIVESDGDTLYLGKGSFEYDLITPLFSDYAHKLRTVHIPEGKTPRLGADGDVIEFPVGTIISKTFYYPAGAGENEVLKLSASLTASEGKLNISELHLIETRLLVRRDDGWDALPYVWNEQQTRAELKRAGDIKKLTLVEGDAKSEFAYLVPDANQCSGCHATNNTTREIVPIGPKIRHLQDSSLFNVSAPEPVFRNVDWTDQSAGLNDRARAYLDINCSHCHSRVGPADTSGLHLEPTTVLGPNLGICKTPIAAGTGTGNRKYGIIPGQPENSIFTFRMASTNPAIMMPELGRSLSHEEGVALIEDWISSLEGQCNTG
ncbi:MAG: hypothetical protein HKN36_06330 [Hellea sp.]|nr:hypothetical protein [Hyphomonadaceae bacterium]NNE57708.1 hypothetical protein [Hellea sp.]